MKRISALSILVACAGMFIGGPSLAADLGDPAIRSADGASVETVHWRRPWPTRECYIWGYYGWREPYCGAMGGFYYPWGASYYLAPQHFGRSLFPSRDQGYPYD